MEIKFGQLIPSALIIDGRILGHQLLSNGEYGAAGLQRARQVAPIPKQVADPVMRVSELALPGCLTRLLCD
jgi:hypothetical protein